MKKLGIEELLTWAFTQELCKVGATGASPAGFSQAWSLMVEMASLGTLIDRNPNSYGVIPDFIVTDDPHPDALLVGDAVKSLARRGGFEIAEGWNPFPEWSDELGLIAADVAAAIRQALSRRDAMNGRHVVSLVATHAIMKAGPDWHADEPQVRMVMHRGKPAWFVQAKAKDSFGKMRCFEADGYDQRKKRPMKGAYRKYELSHSLQSAALSRLDWQLWQDALLVLYTELKGRLSVVDLLPFVPNRQPWVRNARAASSLQQIENA
ncbi:hypothetical protein [Sinorhizobium medicae]|uniref:hypothetical protein n=1 Tax=Sinorhizobium medicae TaxID=110321 RepID=UPI000FD74BC7|nr:hypothetical protein [Sinorhizobium medicae]MDX0517364.1 hypothetical protein [Sinorhizobium medicae]MDX0727967.1 hypothetical protein [Sinorhizobium medicae]MDX0734266.1 hypothetical protein [Sinorhizobium medicae]MDX0814135.1 hypothetical protein [Sinorhizobium medicae]MDX1050683.1 hypothetical protein [Sinorhizobium medicae]